MLTFWRACARLRLSLLLVSLVAVSGLTGIAQITPVSTTDLAATQAGFRKVHQAVAPAVVFIDTRTEERREPNPIDLFFNNGQAPSRIGRASGSGVIIRADGLVLTNSHVVENAIKVTVQLPGSEKKLPAEVVKADPRTDLAVVRITEKGTYPVARLGDASKVQVGDWAIAFGAPFGLPSTMTVGIISATGRHLPSPNDRFEYADLLQTDASINPGNSGGPLVNINGEVVGINFMIYSPGEEGGSVGIGFAIPINENTKQIINTLAAGRAVERGRLGVSMNNLDPTMRETYGVPEERGGIIIGGVAPGLPADKAGIKDEDIIIEFNGTKVISTDQFANLVERTAPGTKVTLTIIRNGKEQKITVTMGADETASTTTDNTNISEQVGITVTEMTQQLANRYRLRYTPGLLVTGVQAGSPAEDAGLQQGDIITRIGRDKEVKTEDEFWTSLNKQMVASKYGVLLRIQRGNSSGFVSLPPLPEKK